MIIAPSLIQKSLDTISDTLIDRYNEENALMVLATKVEVQNSPGDYVRIASVEVERVSRFVGTSGNGVIVFGKICCDIGQNEDDEYAEEKVYSFREILLPDIEGKVKIGKINLLNNKDDL